ncbi:hypothetical protein EVAR_20105_1 [Eumeta japonica]|uniref:Uncharacterized protein n=1 Tax=Eumeta variegata TaxID=151549 RepID=A0A4C1V286_EUMVA|nr:hypothetical protein EVAR_20105_1 [Eumeta japonica]
MPRERRDLGPASVKIPKRGTSPTAIKLPAALYKQARRRRARVKIIFYVQSEQKLPPKKKLFAFHCWILPNIPFIRLVALYRGLKSPLLGINPSIRLAVQGELYKREEYVSFVKSSRKRGDAPVLTLELYNFLENRHEGFPQLKFGARGGPTPLINFVPSCPRYDERYPRPRFFTLPSPLFSRHTSVTGERMCENSSEGRSLDLGRIRL